MIIDALLKNFQAYSEITRRDLLRTGVVGSTLVSNSSFSMLNASDSSLGKSFGKAKKLLFLFLNGGPSQYETFDPKPDAPSDIRGIFKPISTRVPGIHFSELLSSTAKISDKLCVVRSMSTGDPNHESGGYWVNTGQQYKGPNMRAIHPTDWPTFGSIVKMLKPSLDVPFSSVVIPEPIIANPGIFLPGQNAGFLGQRWDPEFFRCDPSKPDFRIEGFELSDGMIPSRIQERRSLVQKFDKNNNKYLVSNNVKEQDRTVQVAMGLFDSSKSREVFRLDREPVKIRQKYGTGKWGQSLLLARRLLESGVRMVFVNWPREAGDINSNNPLWDTHSKNDSRMKDVLCPQFDHSFPALIDDMNQRGLLSETLLVAIGEMGRTPRFNSQGGRDHWGNVWPFLLAGAGIKTGQVVGASDYRGAEVREGKVTPSDLVATMAHLLGINHHAVFLDKTNRPNKITEGEPIKNVLV